MSFNGDPKWTKNITLPDRGTMRCPTCGHVAANADEVMKILSESSYYWPRHIPPKLIFTCSNSECPHCDEDYSVGLAVQVLVILPSR
jgi:hypothetical protein